MRGSTLILALAFLTLPLAGCLGSGVDDDAPAPANGDAPTAPGPHAVIALIDTGINPYHETFRDESPLAWTHPSTYLDGFPEDAPALNLTLNASSYEEAVLADCDVWQAVEPETLYWVPGTRIAGAITFTGGGDVPCAPGDLPGRILDRGGHGTMVASRAAGNGYSLCPECRIVAIQGFTTRAMAWTAAQPFVDAQSNSWGDLPDGYVLSRDERDEVIAAAALQPTFVAGGNGLLGFHGVTGHPAYFDNVAGANGIIMVGGHDGGRVTPWTMTLPHVVADAIKHPAVYHDSISEGSDTAGGGTSGATPFVAGTFTRMILEARALVGDHGTGVRDGALVVADANATLPASGPLADGVLTVEEARLVLFHTANPRPVEDGDWDGEPCRVEDDPLRCTQRPTLPVAWEDVPADVPAYYFIGYGQVGDVTLPDALAVVSGEKEKPERPEEDAFYGIDSDARRTLDEA